MTFACYARWARCRAAHCSLWARQMNLAAFGSPSRRGLAAATMPSLRTTMCAEVRPAAAFAEQGLMTGSVSAVSGVGEELSDGDSLEQLLEQIGSGTAGPLMLIELFGGNSTWLCGPFQIICNNHEKIV
mmetsp:Transcript_13915/g.40136  ORF Transcript_13915/g.40136 Transcript_13915/m.40136 type:complete len:129 (-) Transcript_13915:125-511(-)